MIMKASQRQSSASWRSRRSFHADNAEAPVLKGRARRRPLLALGLDQPGVEHVEHPLGVAGAAPVNDLAQAALCLFRPFFFLILNPAPATLKP
jgi:hypothetical protein